MKENEAGRKSRFENHLPAVIAILAVCILLALMPSRIRLFPYWVFYGFVITMLLPMIVVGITSDKRKWLRLERIVTLGFCFILEACIIVTLVTLIRAILSRSAEFSGLQLFSSSVMVWITNVLVFTLAYWQIDRGGPYARYCDLDVRPDFHFPSQDFSAEVPSGWCPTFIDYLFLGFSTSTAFSMTEAVPITHRAKILIMFQSSVSLATIVVVGARAINILSS